MCLIVYRKEGQILTDDFIRDVAQKNPHGWGIMFNRPSDNKVVFRKGLDLDEFFTNFHPLQEKDIPCVIHFRVRTHGPIDVDNCHPFKVVNGVYFMHNGTINITIPKKDDGKASDTSVFVRDVLAPLLLSVKDKVSALGSSWFEHFMDAQADSHNSRFVVMGEEGPQFYGKWSKTTQGVWVSNGYGYTIDNPTTYAYRPITTANESRFNAYESHRSRAAETASRVNEILTQDDFKRLDKEEIIDFYKRCRMNKDRPRFKTEGETMYDYNKRMAGKVENLIKLPEDLDPDALKRFCDAHHMSTVGAETSIYFDDTYAGEYLKYHAEVVKTNQNSGQCVVPFSSCQNTQEKKNLGTPPKDIPKDVESQEKSGNDTSNASGERQSNEKQSNSEDNDDIYLETYGGWIDLVGNLQDRSVSEERELSEILAEEMEETLDRFAEIAENDWCLTEELITELSDLIVRGELEFKYDATGNSTLSNRHGVIYPDFLSNTPTTLTNIS